MKTNSKGIFFTANEREKERIKKNAAKCGLNTSEYLRQRALGYAPKAVLPDAFFHFCEKLDRLCEPPFSAEVNEKAVALLAEMDKVFLRPQKEQVNEGETLWQPPDSGP
ncbi:plasmid mobilization protein [uncultured Ruminococcus sp.]|uniref:plasmid mobilization protein n=1 Tax=uncultured Ruminococcus sp. TaxID=165186 RepID=UPI00292D16A6|nr:hypothetical protein [uncultured Ruminococcus sp.]